jgi:hypothetical protein
MLPPPIPGREPPMIGRSPGLPCQSPGRLSPIVGRSPGLLPPRLGRLPESGRVPKSGRLPLFGRVPRLGRVLPARPSPLFPAPGSEGRPVGGIEAGGRTVGRLATAPLPDGAGRETFGLPPPEGLKLPGLGRAATFGRLLGPEAPTLPLGRDGMLGRAACPIEGRRLDGPGVGLAACGRAACGCGLAVCGRDA